MYKLFLRYQQILVNGLILGALSVYIFAANSGLKDVFLGIGFGAALVSFGKALGDVKSAESSIRKETT